jgi:ABC-type branched-subunit amino acid transport system ATPase component
MFTDTEGLHPWTWVIGEMLLAGLLCFVLAQAIGRMVLRLRGIYLALATLMARPKLLLLDEPSLGLAPLVVADIFDRMRGLNEKGMALLLVEQNAQLALRLAQRAYVFESGQTVLEGKAQDLLRDFRVRTAYQGA